MSWHWNPAAIAGCCALLFLYAHWTRYRFRARAAAWIAGVSLLLACLCASADLFSIHMARHILLVLVVPALLLVAMPAEPLARALRNSDARSVERFLRRPAVAWLAGIGVMAVWHIPAVYDAAMMSRPLHAAELISTLLGGVLYWWPILSPLPQSRLRPVPQATAYLVSSCLACTAMGIMITFAPVSLYPVMSGGRRVIPAELDQQIGGLLMWVPCCLIYLTGTLVMLARWYGEEPEPARLEV